MTKRNTRWTLFPYCLSLQPDGSYVLLNRDYKPIGFQTREWVKYEAYPIQFKFTRKLSPATIRALSVDGKAVSGSIWLYSDGCIPFAGSKEATEAYMKRLDKLASLATEPAHE
jgi:hypothetical protein